MTIEHTVATYVIIEWFTASCVPVMFYSEMLERIGLG